MSAEKMRDLVTVLRSDFARHGRSLRSPGLWVLAVYRLGRWSNTQEGLLRACSSSAYGALLLGSEVVLGSVLHREAPIGEGIHLIHGHGIRVSPRAILGQRVGIAHDVTIGSSPDRPGAPIIGDDVFIGAGAKVLGPIKIGDRARIAANSLVISDVPADTTAIGVPAKILRYTGRSRGEAPSSPEAAATPPEATGNPIARGPANGKLA